MAASPPRVGPCDGAASFDALVAAHRQRITRLVHRLLGWSGDAQGEVEDVVQDVFLAAWRKFDDFRGEAAAATWLMRIAINRCRSHRRRQWVRLRWLAAAKDQTRRDARETAPDRETGDRKTGSDPVLQPAADGPSPHDAAAQRETLGRVRHALARLRQRDREVIVLHYLDQLDVGAIAGLLGIKRNAVEVRLHRARRRLKDMLET